MICFICNKEISDRQYRQHLELAHAYNMATGIVCPYVGCNRFFSILSSFKRHYRTVHESLTNFGSETVDGILGLTSSVETNTENKSASLETFVDSSCNEASSTNKELCKDFENNLAKYVALSYADPNLPRKCVGTELQHTRSLAFDGMIPILKNVLDQFSVPQVDSIIGKFSNLLDKGFDNFNSEHKRFKYFKERGTFIEPIEIKVGERHEFVKKGKVRRLKLVPCNMYLIPLREVLRSYLSIPTVLDEIMVYMNELINKKGEISNVIQSDLWIKKTELMGSHKLVLPLFLYTDEFETGNVLGSCAGVHKLTGFYTSIACTPPWRASTLESIFLFALFHASDRTKFGNDVFYQPIVDELNFLSETGIFLDTKCYTGQVYFALALTLSDNLGHAQTLSLSESFVANYPCRMCKINKNTLKFQTTEIPSLMRSTENHVIDISMNDVSTTGVKGACLWSKVKYHDIFMGTSVDLMHDVFEGVARLVIPFVLDSLIKRKIISHEDLNEIIDVFPYGPDQKNKPGRISKENIAEQHMKTSSSEMMTLIRYLSVMVGEKVPLEDSVWQLYLYLREITDFLLKTKLVRGSHLYLKLLIESFNECFLNLTASHLRPKFHFLTHYPNFINRSGPPVNYWSMRYEAYHRISKTVARTSANRMNICLTIATKHQLKLNKLFMENALTPILKYSKAKVELTKFESALLYRDLGLDRTLPLIKVKWTELSTVRYQSGTILTLNNMPDGDYDHVTFLETKDVFLYNNNKLIFCCCKFETIGYDGHLCCFRVQRPELPDYVSVFLDDLASTVPHNYYVSLDGNGLITLRQSL
jgi:hypothetical protein